MAPPAARRAAATALRSFAASRRAAATALRSFAASRRASPVHSSLPRSTRRSTPTLPRFAATARISTATPAAARAFLSYTACPAATRSSAAPRAAAFPSTATATPASTRCRRLGARRFSTAAAASSLARSAARFKPRLHRFKPPHRRFSSSIPPEVQTQLNRIEADGMLRHRELLEKLQMLGTKVADSTVNSKRLKIASKWQMAKKAIGVCTTVLLGAALSGSVILKFLQSEWGRAHTESAGKLVEEEMAKLKLDLDSKIDKAMDQKDQEEDSKRLE